MGEQIVGIIRSVVSRDQQSGLGKHSLTTLQVEDAYKTKVIRKLLVMHHSAGNTNE